MDDDANRITEILFGDRARLSKAEVVRRAVEARLRGWQLDYMDRLPEGIVGRSLVTRFLLDRLPPDDLRQGSSA